MFPCFSLGPGDLLHTMPFPESSFKSCHLPVTLESSGAMLPLLTLALLAGPICRAQDEFWHLVYSPDFPSPDLGQRTSGGEGLALSSLVMPSLLSPFLQRCREITGEGRAGWKPRTPTSSWVTRTSLVGEQGSAACSGCSHLLWLIYSQDLPVSHPQCYPVFFWSSLL